jgi:nitrogen regulatory protein PII
MSSAGHASRILPMLIVPWLEVPANPLDATNMIKIEAVILQFKLGGVRQELERRGIHVSLTLTNVRRTVERGSCLAGKQTTELLEVWVKMELIVGDRQARKVVEIITQYARVTAKEAAGHVASLRVAEVLQLIPTLSRK